MNIEKQELRKRMKQTLKALAQADIERKSAGISGFILQSRLWEQARVVLCFLPLPEEFRTAGLITASLAKGKIVGFPRMRGNGDMDFRSISDPGCELVLHPYGVREPSEEAPLVDPALYRHGDVLMITPGLAFDTAGNRLGRGKAFYDHYIARYRDHIICMGVCFREQLISRVPTGPYDQRLEWLATEDGIVETHST